MNGEGDSKVEITDSERIQIENDLAYFERKGLVGLYDDEFEPIIDAVSEETGEDVFVKKSEIVEGLITYEGNYEAELAQFNGEDTYESSTLKAAIHENWTKDIEKEIASKKTNLSITNGIEKKGLEKRDSDFRE